ncbi:hypothetical protein ITJ42_15710 [Clavibacter michiganensis subsp. phaseoli]|uniref:Uncharacterized protein n=1 Tax=Clavibacter phaseoli TaxID=1734031 RepID=A0A8I0SD96_9MICO|nr:hypothetical protein [Clavibacter phaseoli]MBF4632666.1 hypothetical protein [Clavibacter phaseoli]
MIARAVANDLRNIGDVETVSMRALIGCGRYEPPVHGRHRPITVALTHEGDVAGR